MSSGRRVASDCSPCVLTETERELGEGRGLPAVSFHSRAVEGATDNTRNLADGYDDNRYYPNYVYPPIDYAYPPIDYTYPAQFYNPARPRIVNQESISADTQADGIVGDIQGLMSPPSRPPPVLEQDLSSVGRGIRLVISNKEPSTELDPLNWTHQPKLKRRRRHWPQQGIDAKVTGEKACAGCRRRKIRCKHPGKPTSKADDTTDAITPLNQAPQKGERQGSSEFSGNAGDGRFPMPDTVITKIEQLDYAEDLMQSVRSRVLKVWQTHHLTRLEMSLSVPCNVQGFMEQQFHGSNKNLGQVIVLSGTATHGQATTCSDYIRTNWPLRGPWLLDMLQVTFDGAGRNAEGRDNDLQVYDINITTTSIITVDFIGSKEAAIDILQLLVWFGAAFQVSSSDQLQYSQSKLQMFENPMRGDGIFTASYEKSPVSEQSCWFSLFKNPVIAHGFPVPKRRNSERGLELPIELMATLGGGRHAVDFEGGLVIKGHSIAFLPVIQYEDTIQWHMISNSNGTRLRYSDLRIPRALQEEVDFESIRTKRAILGWSQVAQSLLGTAGLDYDGIDWTEAQEAGRSTRLSGGSFGFQSNLIGQLNFALGAKDGRLLLFQNGPLEKIIDLAKKTPVALYDHHGKRAWLVPALEVILHVIHTRSRLNVYKLDEAKTNISYSDEKEGISGQAAKRALMASKDQQLYEGTSPGEKAYCVRDAILDIWSLLERMMERDAVITSAPGVPLRGTMRDKLYGWEFRALVEDKSSFRQKEQVLAKTNGGWVDLVEDTDTIVLFGNGFEEVIKPVPSCSAWKVLPKGRDYLAVGCPMLETLYNEAGSGKTRSYLTSRHLQWHRGPTLFERCEEISGCTCDRLQQLVYDSRITFGRVSPPDQLPQDGCVIFGRAHHPMFPAKCTYAKQQNICSILSGPLPEAKLTKPEPATHLSTTSLGFRPVGDQLPDGNDSSSVSNRRSAPTADYEPESEYSGLALKRRRKVGDQDAGGMDSLNGRQKRSSSRRSSFLGILRTSTKTSRDMRPNLENKDNSKVELVAPDEKDPLDQTPGCPGVKVAFDKYMHCQNRPMLDYNTEVGKGVETRHASMASTAQN